MSDKKQIGTIDITPTWSAVLPIYLDVLGNPKAGTRAWQEARRELSRMASLADLYVASQKKG